MPVSEANPVTIMVDDATRVSGLWQAPPKARASYVFAHGAGAGMTHPFMAAIATGLAERGVATLRYQFPYMERRDKRPDPPKLAHATVRAAATEALPAARHATDRRRQILRRPDDLSGPSYCPAYGCSRTGVSGLPASYGRAIMRV